MTYLRLTLFGSPQLEQAGQPVAIGRRKGLALLAYLALTNRGQQRDALATLLWPDAPQQRARRNLRQILSDLNKVLDGDRLLVEPEQISLLQNDDLELDVARFQSCLALSQAHDHPAEKVCPACLPLLQEAADLYRADFLEGFTLRDAPEFDDWQFFQAESLRQDLAVALERLIQGYSDQADYETAIPYARRWVALDPLREPAQQALMQVYHHSGQSTAALRQYEMYAQVLEKELGLPPDETTTRLYETIKAKRKLKLVLPWSSPTPSQRERDLTSSPMERIEGGADLVAPPIILEQEIGFTTAPDGVRIAYATVGSGPPLVKTANWLTHLEYEWQSPVWRHWLQGLAQAHTLIRYDRRGCGLSAWEVADFSLEAYVGELEAVVDTLGLTRFPLLGVSGGAAVAMTYAYRHPEKVSHLILYGGYARGRKYRTDLPEQAEEGQLLLKLVKLGWGKANPAFRQLYTSLFIPNGTIEQFSWFNDLQRISTSPDNAVRMFEVVYSINVTEAAQKIAAPTLVLHAQEDAVVPCEESHHLAGLIPQARFVLLDSKNHILLEDEPAWPQFLDEVQQFLQTESAQPLLKRETAVAPASPIFPAQRHDPAQQPSPLKAEARQSKEAAKKETQRPGPEELPPGQEPLPLKLGRYELLAEIGRGGFATVYRAHDHELDRPVALKQLKAALLTESSDIKRFRREARLIARLDHPHIVTIYDVGQAQGRHFIVMRLIEGQSLAGRLAQQGRMAWREAVDLIRVIAAGLDYAHQRNILHRDLKPANILLDPERGPLLSDFGLAKLDDEHSLSHSRQVVGTTHYIAPEVWDGQPATPQTDLYALGCILYELVTGQKLFAGETPLAVMRAHFQPLPLPQTWPEDVPAGLTAVLTQALSQQPADRYATAAEFVAALVALTEGQPEPKPSHSPARQAQASQPHLQPDGQARQATSPASSDSFPRFLEQTIPPAPGSVFVARQRELADLEAALESAKAGQGQILFLIGGAGRGKTLLTQEFARRVQAIDPDLIVISGYCDAMTGLGDPYLPFRGALTMLIGDVEAKWAGGLISQAHARRLWELMPLTLPALVERAPDLIGHFVPAAALQSRAATVAPPEAAWFKQLATLTSANHNTGLEQQRIFSQYAALLKAIAVHRPILFIIEDLHWIDAASSGLLFHLSREIGEERILMVGTYRPEEVAIGRDEARHPLAGLVSELKRQHGDIWLDLDDMAAVEGRQFIDAYVDTQPNKLAATFREALFQHTGGYALFTVELLRDMQDRGDLIQDEDGDWVVAGTINWQTLPVKVEGVIETRLKRLDQACQEMLTIASVEGETFTAEIVARVQGVDERGLVQQLSRELDKQHRLVMAQSLERVGKQRLSRYRFRHQLFQHYLYHNLDELERGYLHEEVGNVLEELYTGRTEEVAVQLAWHFQEAGLMDKAIIYLQQAGDGAGRVYAHTEAIAAYRQALTLIRQHQVDDQELTQLYSRLGRTLELNSQFDEALATYQEMERLARQQANRSMELAALLPQVTLYITPTPFHDPVKGLALGEVAVALAREVGDQAAEAKTLWNLALGGMWSGRTSEGIVYGEQAATLARQLNLTELLAYALNDLGMLYLTRLRLEQAKHTLGEAGDLWRELDNLPMLTDSMSMMTMARVTAGEYEQAIALSDEAFQISESSNNLWGQSFSRMIVGWAYWELGRPDQAMLVVEESLRLGKQAGFVASQVLAGGYWAAMYGALGAIEQGLELARQAVAVAETQFPHFRCHPLGVLAQLQIRAGNLAEAEAVIEQGQHDPYRAAHPTWNMRIDLAEAELALKQGDYEQAIAVTAHWLPTLRQNNLRLYTPAMLRLKGQAQLALGQAEAARASWLEARDIAAATGSQANLWPILSDLSQLETNPSEAQHLRRQAQEIVEAIAARIADPELRASFLHW